MDTEGQDWRALISARDPRVRIRDGATDDKLADVEVMLRLRLPVELAGLLLACNGVVADHGVDVIWPCDEIVTRNLAFRNNPDFAGLYMPFDHLLFFGDDGAGDQFAYAVPADGQVVSRRDIFRWEHETDARSWFASDLRQFFDLVLAPSAGRYLGT